MYEFLQSFYTNLYRCFLCCTVQDVPFLPAAHKVGAKTESCYKVYVRQDNDQMMFVKTLYFKINTLKNNFGKVIFYRFSYFETKFNIRVFVTVALCCAELQIANYTANLEYPKLKLPKTKIKLSF